MRFTVGFAAFTLLLLGRTGALQEPAPDAPRVPRVLLFGDVSFDPYFRPAAAALEDRAEVVRSPLGYLSTHAALERFDEIFAGERFDVVAFNFGVNDLMHRDPRTRGLRAMSPAAGGVPVTTLEDYGDHLDEWIERLQDESLEVLWLTTQPIHPQRRSGAVVRDDVARYNAAALERMEARSVAVYDAHAQIVEHLATAPNARSVDRWHNDLLKGDPSGPLVEQLLELLP